VELLGGVVAGLSAPGKQFYRFALDSRDEAKKVVWPTRKETMITTAMVLVMIVVASLFFLFTDTVIRWMLALVLGIGR
jgi:preprotein translocase subunit SecE